jgi:glycosyltransferase involved in cell wall biosynthesis
MTRLSVIIPAYNAEATISRAIDSALEQDCEGVEIVAVNDGSTDSTAKVLERYESRVKTITQPNRGLAAARNAGVAASSGRYLAFLDADDAWRAGYLAAMCAALERSPCAVLAFADIEKVGEHGESLGVSPVGQAPAMQDLLSRACGIYPSAVVMRRTAFDLCGGFCEEFRVVFEDSYMWLLAREHGEFVYVAQPLVIYSASDWILIVDKYESGREVFNRIVRGRYGSAAEPLIDYWTSIFAGGLVLKAVAEIGSGNWRGAWHSGGRLMGLQPHHLLTFRHIKRVFRKQRLKRIPAIFLRALITHRSKYA